MRCVWKCLVVFAVATGSLRADPDLYTKQLKPLFAERCYSCHGALKQKSGLRLDTVAAMRKGGSEGPAVVPGEPDKSLLLQRITATNLEDRMPPEHEAQPLSAEQIALIREWIASGADAPPNEKPESDPRDHWAFRPLQRPSIPQDAERAWIRNPIDNFVADAQRKRGVHHQSEAPPEILLRRLYIDLIGVPPSAEAILAAKADPGATWYEATARVLLQDPRHGERWARHWMDIWRYSDPYGLGEDYRNSQRHIWHWRDWIIESLNRNLPYDEMVRLMLAADELHPTDLDKLRATGFLARNYYIFNRTQWLEETVEHVSKGFLGLTMNCAKCHDHKYDPIRQQDFYALRAFFEPYHVRQELLTTELDTAKDGVPRAFDALLDTPTYLFVRGVEGQPDKSTVIAPGVPAFLVFADLKIDRVSLPAEAYEPERRPGILEAHLEAARRRRDAALNAVQKARQEMAAALRREAELLDQVRLAEKTVPTAKREEARKAVDDARASLNTGEASLAYERAEVLSVKRRVEAMRLKWTSETAAENSENHRDAVISAIKAERVASLAKAQRTVAEAEARLLKAAADKKEATEKELKQAHEAAEKAIQHASTEIKADEVFTRLPGAKWSATRFASSTADDPPLEFPRESSGRRTALARWITDARNPLTSRVAVNHIWARHFGTPLVASSFEFGRKGSLPTHPELLDWLASELIDSGWNMKHIHWLIISSATYRLSSSAASPQENIKNDPDNLTLWRRNPIRLEAEAIRDSMLSLRGNLDRTIGGPPVPTDKQEDSNRRSLYFFHSNNERNLFLTTFDGASVRECYRRDQSIVPQQALALSNSKLALESAGRVAALISGECADDRTFIRRAMLALLAIDPSPTELEACQKALDDFRKSEAVSARARLVWSLMNHNDFVTLR